jgi:pheromone shutdown protein TraB
MKDVSGLVIGTAHEYQRHQDRVRENAIVRATFEELLRNIIADRKVDLIAEEAGDNQEVLKSLKADEAATAAFGELFAELKVVDEPRDPIARIVANELGLMWVDIRSPGAAKMSVVQRDLVMTEKIMEALGSATSVLVICGEDHRVGMSRLLENQGLRVESRAFPDQQ